MSSRKSCGACGARGDPVRAAADSCDCALSAFARPALNAVHRCDEARVRETRVAERKTRRYRYLKTRPRAAQPVVTSLPPFPSFALAHPQMSHTSPVTAIRSPNGATVLTAGSLDHTE